MNKCTADDETYKDKRGTVWTRPTAFAYAMTCNALDRKTIEFERNEVLIHVLLNALREYADPHNWSKLDLENTRIWNGIKANGWELAELACAEFDRLRSKKAVQS